jgi:hypothetical protein
MSRFPAPASSPPRVRRAGAPRWLVPALLAVIAAFFVLSPWPLVAKLQAVGTAVSVNIPSHMLAYGHQTLPMNARNTGIYLGVVVGVALLVVTGRGRANRFPPRAPLALLTGFFVAMVLDGFNSLFDTLHATHATYHAWYPPSNELRVITGTLSGLAMALLIASIANAVLWDQEPEPVVEDTVELGGYLLVCVLVIMLILRRLPALYWPLSLLSVAGVVLLATLVNLVPIGLALGVQRRAATWRAALPSILTAVVMSLCEIAVADLLRGGAA